MGALARHPRRQAAAVYPGRAAADESVVLAAVHWDAREKYRAAARDFPSAADPDFPWAAAVPPVEQGDEPPERPAQPRPAARRMAVFPREQQRLVEPVPSLGVRA